MKKLNQNISYLQNMTMSSLRIEWQKAYQTTSPSISSRMLRLGIAYRLQENKLGGLNDDILQEFAYISGQNQKNGRSHRKIKPGTRLVRSWNGKTIVVLKTDDGFVMDGKNFRSLSQIAKEITGTHWSGPRFFGLTKT